MSVVQAPANAYGQLFRLRSLGDSRAVGQRLLDGIVASAPDGRTATLLSASEEPAEDGLPRYLLEFTVTAPSFARHNLSLLYANDEGILFTVTATLPYARWAELGSTLRSCVSSFHTLN